MKISNSDFNLINSFFNSPVLVPNMVSDVAKALLILDEKIKKWEKKMAKKLGATLEMNPEGQNYYSFPDMKKWRDARDKGFKFDPNPHEHHFLQAFRDYMIIEKQMNAEGKIKPPYNASVLIILEHLIENLKIKKANDGQQTNVPGTDSAEGTTTGE